MDTQVKKHALKKKPDIKPMNFIRGNEFIVKRYNNLASILHIKISMNDLIENHFHGKINRIYDSEDNILQYKGDTQELLDFWTKEYEKLFDKIPASQKTPYTSQELIDALDHGI